MLTQLLHNLTHTWRDPIGEVGLQLQQPLSTIQLGGAAGKDRKINYLVFTPGQEMPLLMMKVARTASYQERLVHEHQSLTTIWQNPILQNSVPQPLGIFKIDNNLVLLEKCLPGTSLKVLLRRRQHLASAQVQQDCQQSIDWLQKMQQVTGKGKEQFAGEEAVTRRLQHLSTPLPLSFSQHLQALAEQFKGINIPVCGHHGDYWPGNLLWHSGTIRVIDWEDFLPTFWPFSDFFLFFINYAHTYPWQGWRWLPAEKTFRYALLEQNWYSDLFVDFTQQYFETIDIPYIAAHLFFALFLIDQATPPATAGQKRQQQSSIWQDRLMLYAKQANDSIFNRSST